MSVYLKPTEPRPRGTAERPFSDRVALPNLAFSPQRHHPCMRTGRGSGAQQEEEGERDVMTTVDDLRRTVEELGYRLVIAADGETRTHERRGERVTVKMPAGGVSAAFDHICQAAGATYVTRGRTEEDRAVTDAEGRVTIHGDEGTYTLKRLFLSSEEVQKYYAGFANQTLWPLCHVVYERPIFKRDWYEGYDQVNHRFAESVAQEVDGPTFVWVNDYQLARMPAYLPRREDTVVGMFWHIPWPTWEIFRILPYKREILTGMLQCDFIGFHRRYQARNFLNAVDHELGTRIIFETNTVIYEGRQVRVMHLPMGIDVDLIRDLLPDSDPVTGFVEALRRSFHILPEPEAAAASPISELLLRYRILLGVDRLDYTKGIPERLAGLDRFFEQNPQYRGEVVYVGVMSPTRNNIPSYQRLQEEVTNLVDEINAKYGTEDWQPLHMIFEGCARDEIADLYQHASVCLVTPLDDGMNLVSKEYVVAASEAETPGMLVLSQFAGSATDLQAALLVNPYDPDAVAEAIKVALEMDPESRRERIDHMMELLEDRNVYRWATDFIQNTVDAARRNQLEVLYID
jgi:trehalose-6-phosphate synthase